MPEGVKFGFSIGDRDLFRDIIMKVQFKKFNSQIKANQKIATMNVDPNNTVAQLKRQVREKLKIQDFFHFEGNLFGFKVLLTDSFPLNFFFPDSEKIVIFLESHSRGSKKSKIPKSSFLLCLQNLIISGNLSQFMQVVGQNRLSLKELDEKTALNGWQLIHYASLYGREEILKFLLKQGCNINMETSDNWTPLILAASHGRTSCVSVLLKNPQVQINKVTKRGTALHVAVEYNHLEVVSLLLNSRACCTVENFNGKIPLELANDEDIIDLIPRYLGCWELEKYSKKTTTVLFSGELLEYSEFSVNDRHSFLVVNLENGFLEIFSNREAWVKKRTPRENVRIVDIQLVDAACVKILGPEVRYFFRTVYQEGVKVFFASDERVRDEWIQVLTDAVKYCQIHKIGIDSKSPGNLSNKVFIDTDLDVDAFKIVDEIGAGSFGTVFKVIKKDNNKIYAMKKLSKKLLIKKKMLKYAISECKIMKNLHHPFVLELFYCFENSNYIFLVLEFCPGGDLESLLDGKALSESKARFYLAEIVVGLEYLHGNDVIYRDLKPANILIDEEGHIKLADFGIAKSSSSKDEAASTLIGSPAYISPEVLCYEKLSKASDIYSFGIVMHELLTGIVPFADYEIDKLFSCIKTGDFELSEELSQNARDLIIRLINRNTHVRPSLQDIKRHPFFKPINWNFVKSKKYEVDSFN
jgi:ankyrin repeat protein/tRNA A-37 threonylcarbamoyl transferase component Bud32